MISGTPITTLCDSNEDSFDHVQNYMNQKHFPEENQEEGDRMPSGSDDPDNSEILYSQPIQDQTTKTNGVSSGHSNTQNPPYASLNSANTQTNLALVKRNKGRPAKEEAKCVTKGYKELDANKCRQITRHFMRDVKRDEKDLVARANRGEDQLTKASIPKIRVF